MNDQDIMDLIDTMIQSGVIVVNKKSLFKTTLYCLYFDKSLSESIEKISEDE